MKRKIFVTAVLVVALVMFANVGCNEKEDVINAMDIPPTVDEIANVVSFGLDVTIPKNPDIVSDGGTFWNWDISVGYIKDGVIGASFKVVWDDGDSETEKIYVPVNNIRGEKGEHRYLSPGSYNPKAFLVAFRYQNGKVEDIPKDKWKKVWEYKIEI